MLLGAADITPRKKVGRGILGERQRRRKKDEAYEQARKREAATEDLWLKDRSAKEVSCENDLLYRWNWLWVPKGLVQRIMESEHDTKVAGHMGQDKTIELIQRNFWWPKMNERIIDFVRSCPECQQNKVSRHQPYRLSSPLE